MHILPMYDFMIRRNFSGNPVENKMLFLMKTVTPSKNVQVSFIRGLYRIKYELKLTFE